MPEPAVHHCAEPASGRSESHTGAVRGVIPLRWRYLGRLLRLLWDLSPRTMVLQAVLTMVLGSVPLLGIVAIRRLVDAGTAVTRATAGQRAVREAVLWGGLYLCLACAQSALVPLARVLQDQTQETMKARVQEKVLTVAQELPLSTFEEPHYYDLLQRVQRWIDHRLFTTIGLLLGSGNQAITIASLVIYLGRARWSIPLVLAVGIGGSVLLRVRALREKYLLERRQTEPERRLDYISALMCSRPAAGEVRLFRLGLYLRGQWRALLLSLRASRYAMAWQEARSEAASSLTQSVTFGVVLFGVIYSITRGALTIGQYAAFCFALEEFHRAALSGLWNLAVVDNDFRYVEDFFRYLDVPREVFSSGPGPLEPVGPVRVGIRLEGVEFTYPGCARPVLRGVELTIRPGERIALVGQNGAGKSTLARLLLKLYEPTGGRILVDGTALAEVDPREWRTRCVAVFQDFQRYQLTLRDNIAVGDLTRGRDPAAVEGASAMSGADRIAARLPHGYDTPLGKSLEAGSDLSTGQWQQVAIARAYMRDASAEVVVLDEPTSALDARAEVELYRRFRDAFPGRMVVLISHRLASARLADRIVVLHEGVIVEDGTHDDLLSRGGRYAHMYRLQSEWYDHDGSREKEPEPVK